MKSVHKSMGDYKVLCGRHLFDGISESNKWEEVTCKSCLKFRDFDATKLVLLNRKEK